MAASGDPGSLTGRAGARPAMRIQRSVREQPGVSPSVGHGEPPFFSVIASRLCEAILPDGLAADCFGQERASQ